jgi:hypothetical protein
MKSIFFSVFINICLFGQSNWEEINGGDNIHSISQSLIYEDSSYMPLHVGNLYQYIRYSYSGGIVSYSLKYGEILIDTLINGVKYYYYSYDNSNHWFRYSEMDKKLYEWLNEDDLIYMDFNKAPGDTFMYLNYSNYPFPATVLGGNTNLFSMDYLYKGYIVWIGIGSTKKELFAPGLGTFNTYYSSQAPHGGNNTIDFTLIMATLHDSLGNIHFFTDHVKPEISLIPITLIDSSNFKLNFTVTHQYNRLTPPGHISMFFIDFVKFDSYYSKEDSVIEMPIINATGVINFSVNTNLDTTLLKNGFTFNYRIIAKDKGIIPETSYSPDTGYYKCIWNGPTGIDDKTQFQLSFFLSQNYPNPFNPSTIISYQLPVSGDVTLKVFDVLGREVATLVNEEKQPGVYEVEFVASQLSSGIYFYTLEAGEFRDTKKLILIK